MSDFHNILNHDKPLHSQSSLIDHALIVPDEFRRFSPPVDDFAPIWNLHTSYYNAMHPDNLKNQLFLFSDVKMMPVTAPVSSNSPSISYDTPVFASPNSSSPYFPTVEELLKSTPSKASLTSDCSNVEFKTMPSSPEKPITATVRKGKGSRKPFTCRDIRKLIAVVCEVNPYMAGWGKIGKK